MPELSLTYAASLEDVETGEPIDDPQLLAACDGVRGHALVFDTNAFSGEVKPKSMMPVLVWNTQTGLALRIRIDVRGEVPPQFLEEAAALIETIRDRTGIDLDLPEGLEHASVWHGALRDPVPTTQADEIAALAAEWRDVTFERLAALPDDALARLGARLGALGARLSHDRGSDRDALWQLAAAVRAHQQRRIAEQRYGR